MSHDNEKKYMVNRREMNAILAEVAQEVEVLIRLVCNEEDAKKALYAFYISLDGITDEYELSYTIETARRLYSALYRTQQIILPKD